MAPDVPSCEREVKGKLFVGFFFHRDTLSFLFNIMAPAGALNIMLKKERIVSQ